MDIGYWIACTVSVFLCVVAWWLFRIKKKKLENKERADLRWGTKLLDTLLNALWHWMHRMRSSFFPLHSCFLVVLRARSWQLDCTEAAAAVRYWQSRSCIWKLAFVFFHPENNGKMHLAYATGIAWQQFLNFKSEAHFSLWMKLKWV